MNKSSYVIATFASFIVGIFGGDFIRLDLWWLFGLALGLIIAVVIMWRDKYWRLGLLILIGLAIGLSYFNFWDGRQKAVQIPLNKEVEIEGNIVGHPDFSGSQANYILKYLPAGEAGQRTKIRLTAGRYPEYHYGDILKFKGVVKEPYPYFFHQGILGQVYNPEKVEKVGYQGNIAVKIIYAIRDRFEESLNRSLSEPYASFAAGLVLGSKRNIPDSLLSDFNRTGTTHIIAVSGYNVTIIIVWIALILGIFSRKLKFWGSLLVIIGFVVMTGAPASVVRAGILAGLVAFGHFEGRRINMTVLLLLVAAVMLFFNPYALKYDISFQLSFLAFCGLVYLSPIISNLKIICWIPNFIRQTFSETMGAQIMVFPILIYAFGRVSLVSPIVNILILWIVPISMALVFITGFAGLILISFGQVISLFSWLFLKYIIIVVESFSQIPWASYNLKNSEWWWMAIFYFFVGLLVFKFRIKLKKLDKLG